MKIIGFAAKIYIVFLFVFQSKTTVEGSHLIASLLHLVPQIITQLNQSGNTLSKCTLCQTISSIFREFSSEERSREQLVSVIRWGCKFFKVETDDVCDEVVNQFEDELPYIFSRTNVSNYDVCAFILNPDCGEPDNNMNWTVKETTIPKPTLKSVPLPNANAPTLRVLHLSDAHIDLEYAIGSSADCKQPLCCHNDSIPSGSDKAERWGSFSSCDLPLETFENMLKYIHDNVKVDYAIWTGDIVSHKIWDVSRDSNLNLMKTFHSLLKKYLPNLPIYLALGNHETVPVDSFPMSSITGNRSIEWLYSALVQQWSPWLPVNTSDTILNGGYYVHRSAFPGFRIISLNMNYCNTLNFWLLFNSTDPQHELAWLVDELQDAENAGDKVHIIGHIPPGYKDCFGVWSENYNNIVNRYESTVRGQFFGHTHADEFEIFYDQKNKSRPFGVAHIGPSVTTYTSGNPAFRVYTIDGNYTNSTWTVLDHETYYMNLTRANLNPEAEPVWYKAYDMKQKFGLKSLTPEDYNDLSQEFMTNDTALQTFFEYYTKLNPSTKTYDSDTKKKLLCNLVTSRSNDINTCLNSS